LTLPQAALQRQVSLVAEREERGEQDIGGPSIAGFAFGGQLGISKCRVKKIAGKADAVERLRAALAKGKKADLIDILVELASSDRNLFRRLGVHFKLESPPEELAAATRLAIADATDFDEREINRNFSYDYVAHDEVRRNLSRLVELGQLPLAMELCLELMKQGSYRVEMSDEGMMTADIEECLAVVVKAIKSNDPPPADVIAWCDRMLKNDRVGFIYREELQALRSPVKPPRT
jgi:hypothetical protein